MTETKLVNDLIHTTVNTIKYSTKKADREEAKAAKALLTALLGRKPTAEELKEALTV